jgi:hypothetical protein
MLVNMLAQHSQVAVPTEGLNYVQEYWPLHQLFIQFMDATPLHAKNYAIDKDELRFVLDAYMLTIDKTKPACLLKLPYYPLTCLDFFVDYFQGNIAFGLVQRPIEKVVQSFQRRGQDKRFFDDCPEFFRQIKKLPPEQRGKYLANKDAIGFFYELRQHCHDTVRTWQQGHPQHPFVDIDVEQIATSKAYLSGLLAKLGLATDDADAMLKVVDQARLLEGKQKRHFVGNFKFGLKKIWKRIFPKVA